MVKKHSSTAYLVNPLKLTFETTNLKLWCFVLGSLDWFTYDAFALAVWAQGFVPEAATSHGVLNDTFRHFLATSKP